MTRFTVRTDRTFKGHAGQYEVVIVEADGVFLGDLTIPVPFVEDFRRRLTDTEPSKLTNLEATEEAT